MLANILARSRSTNVVEQSWNRGLFSDHPMNLFSMAAPVASTYPIRPAPLDFRAPSAFGASRQVSDLGRVARLWPVRMSGAKCMRMQHLALDPCEYPWVFFSEARACIGAASAQCRAKLTSYEIPTVPIALVAALGSEKPAWLVEAAAFEASSGEAV